MHTGFQSLNNNKSVLLQDNQANRQNFARKTPIDPYARTAGSIHTINFQQLSAKQNTLNNLANAHEPQTNFDTALAYAADNVRPEINEASDETEYSFGDVIDAVNPLHHIPLISTLYRGITGDDIKPAAQILGGTLYGGPVGAISSTVNVVVEHETGRDMTGNALAILAGDTIREPDIQIDYAKDLLNFTSNFDSPAPSKAKTNNFWNAAQSYKQTRGYNS